MSDGMFRLRKYTFGIFVFNFFFLRFIFQVLSVDCTRQNSHWIKVKQRYPPWRPIELREVKAPTLLRQTVNRWRQGCQPYARPHFSPKFRSYQFFFSSETTDYTKTVPWIYSHNSTVLFHRLTFLLLTTNKEISRRKYDFLLYGVSYLQYD
jgi:hypothetical protein